MTRLRPRSDNLTNPSNPLFEPLQPLGTWDRALADQLYATLHATEKLRSYKLPRSTRQTQQPRPLGKAATAQRRGTLQTDSSRIISNFLEIRPRCGPSAVAVALPAFLLGTLCSEYQTSLKKTTWHRIHVSKKICVVRSPCFVSAKRNA